MVQAAGPLVDSITDTQAKICVHEGAMIIHPSIIIGKVLLDYRAEEPCVLLNIMSVVVYMYSCGPRTGHER